MKRPWTLLLSLIACLSTYPGGSLSGQGTEFPLYAGTSGTGAEAAEIYRLSDVGTWQRQLGLSAPPGRDVQIQDFDFFIGRLYAATHSFSGSDFAQGTYFTTDGVNWNRDRGLRTDDIFALSAIRDRLYAGAIGGLYELRLGIAGFSWLFREVSSDVVNHVVEFGGRLYAGTHGGGLWVSSNDGSSWSQVPGFPMNGNVWTMAVFSNRLYIGTIDGRYYQSANGTIWSVIPTISSGSFCPKLAAFGQRLVAIGTDNCELFQSQDGMNWQKLQPNIGFVQVIHAAEQSGVRRLYAGTNQSIRFTQDLINWTDLPRLPRGNVSALIVHPSPGR